MRWRLMILACLTLALLVLTKTVFPDTRVGQALRSWLVERPAEALSRFGAGRALALAVLLLSGLVLFELGGAEGIRLFVLGAPEAMAWFIMFDVGMLLDVMLIAVAAGGAVRLRAVRDLAQGLAHGITVRVVRPMLRAGRAVRSIRARRTGRGRPGDGDRPTSRGFQPAFG